MLDVGPETLRKWVVQAQIDAGRRPGATSAELEEIKRLKKENRDPKKGQRDSEGGIDFYVDCAIMPTSDQSDGVQPVRCWRAVRRESA